MSRALVSVVELGGYPDFGPLYRRLGFEPETVTSGRRALSTVKKLQPEAVVAEFNFQSDFRDRTSALESLLALAQAMPDTRIVVIYEPRDEADLDRLRKRFPAFTAIPRPVNEADLERALQD